MREFDWIVRPSNANGNGTWTDPRSGAGYVDFAANTLTLWSMVLPATSSVNAPQFFESDESWTLEAVRGQMIWTFDPTTGTANYSGMLRVMMMIGPVTPSGTPWIDAPSFDLNDVDVANRDFVFSRIERAYASAGWTDRVNLPFLWKWDVHVKSRRRVQAGESLWCAVQWESEDTVTPGPLPRLELVSNLRVLGSKRV